MNAGAFQQTDSREQCSPENLGLTLCYPSMPEPSSPGRGASEAATAVVDLNELIRLGDDQRIKQMGLPVHDMPELSVKAAEHGRLPLLRWLVQQQQPACPIPPSVCEIAATRCDVEMLRFLVASGLAQELRKLTSDADGGSFLALAQAGVPMHSWDSCRARVAILVEAWYVMVGLQQWAAHQAAPSPQQPEPCSSRAIAALMEPWQAAPAPLLMQLGRLPYDLAIKIASDAFLSPQQAAQIDFPIIETGIFKKMGICDGYCCRRRRARGSPVKLFFIDLQESCSWLGCPFNLWASPSAPSIN